MHKQLPPEEIEKLKHSHIRSFSTRKGRISNAQERAIEELLPLYEVPYDENKKIDAVQIFGNEHPFVFEIGCGMGETTCAIAEAHPDINFLGSEIFPPGLGATSLLINAKSLKNIRLVRHDAVDVVNHMIPDESLDGIHVFFPDPWRKARHHKRRLISDAFVQALAPKLKNGAYLHCATDWENYANEMLEILNRAPHLKNLHDGFAPEPTNPLVNRPKTKFNLRGDQLGHGCWDLVFVRV